jgi:hypothetical protein
MGIGALPLVLALAVCCLGTARAADDGPESAQATVRQASRRAVGASLDDRVGVLSQALDLDATQQVQLRKVLENQREQVGKIWNDVSIPAAYRVNATRAISDDTADKIRSLLTEEQRGKYNPPKRPREKSADHAGPSVEDWMKSSQPKAAGQLEKK